MNKIKCYFCPNLVTNQSKLVLVPEKGGSYYTCNLCWLKERVKLSQRIINQHKQLIKEYQTKISKLEKKEN